MLQVAAGGVEPESEHIDRTCIGRAVRIYKGSGRKFDRSAVRHIDRTPVGTAHYVGRRARDQFDDDLTAFVFFRQKGTRTLEVPGRRGGQVGLIFAQFYVAEQEEAVFVGRGDFGSRPDHHALRGFAVFVKDQSAHIATDITQSRIDRDGITGRIELIEVVLTGSEEEGKAEEK